MLGLILLGGCNQAGAPATTAASTDTANYCLLRLALEKKYGYPHAARISNHLKILGTVSMDEQGNLVAPGNLP